MSATQSFRYARVRRQPTSGSAAPGRLSKNCEAAALDAALAVAEIVGAEAAEAVDDLTSPMIVAGVAASDANTVTTVAGATGTSLTLDTTPVTPLSPSSPLTPLSPLTQVSASAESTAHHSGVPLERRSRPRNGKSVRVLNVAIAAALLVVVSPVMLLIALAVRLTSRGPIIYKQVRVGRDRRHYDLLSPSDRRALQRREALLLKKRGRPSGMAAREIARQTDAERRAYAAAAAEQRRGERGRRTSEIAALASASTGASTTASSTPIASTSAASTAASTLAAADARRGRVAAALHDRRTWNTCGESFTMYKFRTMRVDAESGTGAVWAQKSDPRVTPIGAFLRKCRLDELPQLINVLLGDMNIVGPRPERPTIIPDLVQNMAYYPIRQRTRPGITGLAQIRHGYDTTMDDVKAKVRYDLEYLRRRSVLQDLRIMVQTPLVMFFKRTGQ